MIGDGNPIKPMRKEIILQEAARLFRQKGYMAATLRELADRSGIKGGSIYHHFSSKQEILHEIMAFTLTNLFALEEETAGERNPIEKIRKAIRFHIEYHINNLDETLVADTELRSLTAENYREIIKMRRRYENLFIDILREGVQQEIIKIGDVKLAALAILQMCTGVSYWFKQDGPLSVQEIADGYVELICWGIMGKESR
ncbi:MAG: TetR/AcrR family transcriptional regulator [Desulfoferrobacter sp.]